MKPEDFARQFFDMWQDSFDNASKDDALHDKLLHLMEQSNLFWQADEKKETQKLEILTPYDAPNQQPAKLNGHSEDTIQRLAERVEKCEQRIHVLEAMLRSRSRHVSNDRTSHEEREPKARIPLS